MQSWEVMVYGWEGAGDRYPENMGGTGNIEWFPVWESNAGCRTVQGTAWADFSRDENWTYRVSDLTKDN